MNEIHINLTENVCDITNSFENGRMTEELIEFIAEREESLLDTYLENGYDQDLWLTSMKNMIKDNQMFPLASGSALQDIGIEDFLEKLDLLTVTDYSSQEPFAGRVYKIRHDCNGTRITFIKALSGTLKVRDDNPIWMKMIFLKKLRKFEFIMEVNLKRWIR